MKGSNNSVFSAVTTSTASNNRSSNNLQTTKDASDSNNISSSSGGKSDNRASKLCRVGLYDLVPGPPLGKGNFAVVRLGIHRLTKTKVAVKIVDKADLEDDNLHKITREIEIMRRLSHPAITRLYQVKFVLRCHNSIIIITNTCDTFIKTS